MTTDAKPPADSGPSALEARAEEAIKDPAVRKAAAGFLRRQFGKLSFKWKVIVLGGGGVLLWALVSWVYSWLVWVLGAAAVVVILWGLKMVFTGSPKLKS